MSKQRLQRIAARLPEGLYIYTYSPGDGVTRYRISPTENGDYFSCEKMYTALGIGELERATNLLTNFYYFKMRDILEG